MSRRGFGKRKRGRKKDALFSHLGPRIVPGRPVGALDKHIDGLGRRALRDSGLFFRRRTREERVGGGGGRRGKKVRWRSSKSKRLDRSFEERLEKRGPPAADFLGSLRFALFFGILRRLLDATSCIEEAAIEIDREAAEQGAFQNGREKKKRIELCLLFSLFSSCRSPSPLTLIPSATRRVTPFVTTPVLVTRSLSERTLISLSLSMVS